MKSRYFNLEKLLTPLGTKALYRCGATLALPAIHRAWTPLGLLCERLQAQFDHPANANVYITPLQQKMAESLERLRAADANRLLDAFTSRVRAAQLPRPPPFRVDVMVIDPESRLEVRPSSGYVLTEEDGKTMLEFKSIRYQLQTPVAATVRAMIGLTIFRVVDLPNLMAADARLALARQLYDIGFLTQVR